MAEFMLIINKSRPLMSLQGKDTINPENWNNHCRNCEFNALL